MSGVYGVCGVCGALGDLLGAWFGWLSDVTLELLGPGSGGGFRRAPSCAVDFVVAEVLLVLYLIVQGTLEYMDSVRRDVDRLNMKI